MIKIGKQGKEIVISSKAILKGILIVNILVIVMRIVMAIVAQKPVVEEVFDGTEVGTFIVFVLWLLYSEEDSKKEKQDEE